MAPDSISALERLAALHRAGALTDAEFAAEKRRVLGEPPAPVVAGPPLVVVPAAAPPARPRRRSRAGSFVAFVVVGFAISWGLAAAGGPARLLQALAATTAPAPKPAAFAAPPVLAPAVPQPVVVQASDDGSRSTIFHRKLDVKAEVLNRGAAGFVVVRSRVEQDGRVWERDDRRYMERGERAFFSFAYNRLSNGHDARYRVTAAAE